MSTRDDVTLSAKERTALAGLEAQASADDPTLAARLRGRWVFPVRVQLPTLSTWTLVWGGAAASVGGLALIVLTLGVGLWAGVVSALVALAGLRALGEAWARRFAPELEEESAEVDVGRDPAG